ncbi:hypothetical protein KCP73_14415 [Salmonella enterica subsp. enterica]|nr:hypothetical protein KCP73_14415 [Salmonella enterica subsp. enterica]
MINTPLAFSDQKRAEHHIFGEPGRMGTGWRAARDPKRRDISAAKPVPTTIAWKDAWFLRLWSRCSSLCWIYDHRRDEIAPPLPARSAIKSPRL